MATVTFLFVDQVRSTEQLARLGDKAAQSVRQSLFDLLREATSGVGGREVDSAGDGMFCAFDGAADAISAAVTMHQLVGSLNADRAVAEHLAIRVGIHTGEPLESPTGGYFGTAVVVASRLCAAADEGAILVSELVRVLVQPRGDYEFEPVGPLLLKGVEEPVTGHTVRWTPDHRRAPLPSPLAQARSGPLVGRDEEMNRISRAWAEVQNGGRQLVLVSGDRGSGVTRLMAEAAHQLFADGSTVWFGRALGPTAHLTPWAESVGAWAEATSRAHLRLRLGPVGADLARLVPPLRSWLSGLPPPATVHPATEPFLIAAAIDHLIEQCSRQQPIVCVLDQLEDADPASLEVLSTLLRSTRPARLLILVGFEPAGVGTPRLLEAFGRHAAADIRLRGLDEHGVRALLLSSTQQEPGADTVRAVLNETEGSPYFVLQMALALTERRLNRQVNQAVGRAEELRLDLRLQREEISLGLRQLDQLRTGEQSRSGDAVEPDGTPPAPVHCPYRGLPAFQPEDAGEFFGRDALVAEMVARLVTSRVLGVIGPSGSGKSSAVRAGLVSALAQDALSSSSDWPSLILTPGVDPIASLTDQLLAVSPQADRARLVRDLRDPAPGRCLLGEVARASGRPFVLVVDQMEQLWTASTDADRYAFLLHVVEAATDVESRVLVVMILRADFYGRITDNPALSALLADSQVLVPPMTSSEMRAAIEGPARAAGLVLEPGLAQAVIDDVGVGAGSLPLLSTALQQTWERRRGRSLTLTGYAEIGGARTAIATLADRAMEELSPEQLDTAQRLFARLAAPGVDGTDVSRPASISGLSAVGTHADAVLTRLAERRLITIGSATVQLAHDALLREWPRLRGWLDEDRAVRRLHQQLATDAERWDGSGRDPDVLRRGVQLGAAENLAVAKPDLLSALEKSYLDASVTAHQQGARQARQRLRRLQALALALIILLAAALTGGGFAVAQRQTAARRATQADARGLAAQALSLAGSDVDQALLLAVEGYRLDPSIESESGLLAALNGARYLSSYHRGLPVDAADVTLTPDRKTLLMLTQDGVIRSYSTSTWQPIGAQIETGYANPYPISVSRDGRQILVGGGMETRVFDRRTGSTVGRPIPTPLPVPVFGSRGTVISSSFREPGITITEVASGKKLANIQFGSTSNLIDVSPTGKEFVATGYGSNYELLLRRFRSDGKPAGKVVQPQPDPGSVENLLYSPRGDLVAISHSGGSSQLYDSRTLKPVGRPFQVRGSRTISAAFSPNNKQVAVLGDDGSITVASTADGSEIATLSGLLGGTAVRFLDDHRLVAVTPTETAEFDLQANVVLGHAADVNHLVTNIVAHPDRKTALIAQADGGITTVDASLQEVAAPLRVPVGTVDGLAVSADQAQWAVHGYAFEASAVVAGEDPNDGHIVILDADRKVTRRLTVKGDEDPGFSFSATRMTFSPDGRRLAVGTISGLLTVIDLETGRPLIDGQRTDISAALGLMWSRDGSVLFQGGQNGTLRALDPATGRLLREQPLTPGITLTTIVSIPGTDHLAVSSESGSVFIVDASSLKQVGQALTSGSTQLQAIVASPDGARLAAVSRDGAVRLWDRSSGRPIGPPIGTYGDLAQAIAYLDDHTLLTGGMDGGVSSWDMAPQAWVSVACRLAGRNLTEAEWAQYLPDRAYRQTCTA